MAKPLFDPTITDDAIDQWIGRYLKANEDGARNCDVSRALGLTKITDQKQWISYRSLQRLIEAGSVTKDGAIYHHKDGAGT